MACENVYFSKRSKKNNNKKQNTELKACGWKREMLSCIWKKQRLLLFTELESKLEIINECSHWFYSKCRREYHSQQLNWSLVGWALFKCWGSLPRWDDRRSLFNERAKVWKCRLSILHKESFSTSIETAQVVFSVVLLPKYNFCLHNKYISNRSLRQVEYSFISLLD